MTEKVLPYDRSIVVQETGWWCGPASTQIALNTRGIFKLERDLMYEIEALEGNNGWDDQDGTDSIHQVATVLNRYLGGGYVVRQIPNDTPTPGQRDRLWDDIVRSIDGGYGVIVNIVAPPSNYPRGVKGSVSPRYSGGTVYHYMTVMGYDDVERAVWMADSGFPPYGYWMSFDQLVTLIPPKGYAAKPVGAQPPPPPAENHLYDIDRDMRLALDQIAGYPGTEFKGWPQLGNRTIPDAIAAILDHLEDE